MRIISNHIPRTTIYWEQLTLKERKEFDYLDSEEKKQNAEFVRYRNWVYEISEFMFIGEGSPDDLKKWDGYRSDSYFSGIVIKWEKNDRGGVIMGTYTS